MHVPRSGSITVAEAGENWVARAKRASRERGTVEQYRGHLVHINHPIYGVGTVKLADFTTPQVATFDADLDKAGVSEAMRRKLIVSLRSLLRIAMVEGKVNRNVALGYRVEESSKRGKKLKIGVDVPSAAEIHRFRVQLDKAGDPWRPFFLTALFTGMRASELRGPRWVNVDLVKGEIHVRERADIFHEMGAPKSSAGERTIPITKLLVNVLTAWKLASPKGELGLVFPTRNGRVQSLANIRKRGLIPLMQKAAVTKDGSEKGKAKYGGMHALRHFHASLLINAREQGGLGYPPKVVQERLGHSTLAMTMDVYGHLFPRADDADQMQQLDKAIFG